MRSDALVNCAAIQPYGTVETTTPAEWNKVIGINLTGYYLMAHFLYPLLKQAGSASIVNFASVQGHMNQNNVLGYATSKGAIHALTRAMAVDCAKDGIRVNSISPGSIMSPMLEFSARSLTPEGGDWEETLAGFGRAHSAGRVGTIEEVARAGVLPRRPGVRASASAATSAIDGGLRAKLGRMTATAEGHHRTRPAKSAHASSIGRRAHPRPNSCGAIADDAHCLHAGREDARAPIDVPEAHPLRNLVRGLSVEPRGRRRRPAAAQDQAQTPAPATGATTATDVAA